MEDCESPDFDEKLVENKTNIPKQDGGVGDMASAKR